MPMTWTAESNAKLFLGVLELLKHQNVKLDYGWLAEYMGPDCTKRAIDHQIQKLKKQAGARSPADESSTASASAETTSTPAPTPKKRRAPGSSRSTPAKKAKMAEEEDGDDDEVERRIMREIKQELEDLRT
ncbi:hypothetical protein BJX61DRAFT_539389 [Aspergillus egyptiacus]|nr:hypothetical protein BJX61DRAFT_539389 [Aspergillus egyptiacus]